MEWSEENLKKYIDQDEISHDKYGSEKKMWDFFKDFYKKFNLKFFFS